MKTSHNAVVQLLHWVMAAAILAMLFIGVWMTATISDRPRLIAVHQPLGLLILVLGVVRLAGRLLARSSPLPPSIPRWQVRVAGLSHTLMYALFLTLPLIGWAMLSAGGYPVRVTQSLVLPAIAPRDATSYTLLREAHRVLAHALFALVVLHIAAALHHAWIRRDGVFGRIFPAGRAPRWLRFAILGRMRTIILLATLVLVLVPSYAAAVDRHVDNPFQVRSEVYARNGMAATSHPIATQVALDILKQGGSAVDAAIAANAFIGFAEPTGNGIGGDLFALVWDADGERLHALNGSGRSPALATIEAVREAGHDGDVMPPFGPLPVTVPGTVDAWFELHDRFGKLPIADVLAPAIRYAREGVPVPEQIAWYWERNLPRIGHYPGFAEVFTRDGETYRKGDVFRNPRLADTLEKIAEGGRDAFYRGDIARAVDAYMREQGGLLRYDDFAAHESEWVEPVSTNYRGYDVWQIPPNGQGIAVLQMLNILERHDVRAMGFGSAEYMHLFTEAKKLAFEDRARFYADQGFAAVPVERLISKEYAAERARLINPRRASRELPPGTMPEHPDTIYLTVADADGNMVSLIQSNYRGMGSGMTPGDLGFILQNRGEAFALVEGHPNALAPRKRPFHTIIPAFVTRDGAPWLSFGLMGGAMQPQGHVQIVVNLIDFDMNLQQAGDAPRMYHEGSTEPDGVSRMQDGGKLYVESGIEPRALRRLRAMGHTLATGAHYGGYQAIMRDENGNYVGATESRKDGQAAGY